jgi:hypothetical protein
MRLAHLVIAVSVGSLSWLEGCGGGADAAGDADDAAVFYPDVAGQPKTALSAGWRSFTVTFAAETVTSKAGAGSSGLPSVMEGRRMRLDFDNGAFRTNHLAGAAFIDEFADPVGFGGTAGYPLILHSDRTRGSVLSVEQATSTATTELRFDSVLFELDGHALPLAGVLKGVAYVHDRGGDRYGEVTASFVASADLEAPRWRARSTSAFAPTPLPWDERIIETSEPYEGHVAIAALFPATSLQARPLSTPLLWGAPPKDREYGLMIALQSWDDATTLTSSATVVRDLAGNASSIAGALSFPGAAVAKLETGVLEPSEVGLDDVTEWGPIRIESCPGSSPAASCYALGPVEVSACAPSSVAGFAARLKGEGATTFELRAVAKGDGYYGAPFNAVYVASAIPGQPARIDGSTIRWSAPVADTYDTGWTTVTMAALGAASETGVAVSVGGLGPPAGRSLCDLSRRSTLTLHVRRIHVGSP